jgi:hypothetical protein
MDTKPSTDETVKRRGGRPVKAARKGRRYQIGVVVTGETKAVIAKAAKESGRTISREVEILILRCLNYDQALAAMRTNLADMEKDGVEAAFLKFGYTPIRVPNADNPDRPWKLWAEPGYPGIQASGFEAWQPGELKAAFPDYEDDVPEPVEPPPLPPEMAGIDPDRLFLVPVPGEGWKWMVASPRGGDSAKGESK